MPERFDLLKVDYIDTDKIGLAFAPCCKVAEGDIVETAHGRAFVVMREGFCSKDEKILKMIDGLVPVDRVLTKISVVKYDEDA